MGAFLWAGRGNWLEGRRERKKRGSKRSKSPSQIKVVCALCRKLIPKASYYKHREEVHGIVSLSLKDLRVVKDKEDKGKRLIKKNDGNKVKKKTVKESICITCSLCKNGSCILTDKKERRNHCLFYKSGENK